MSTTTNRAGRSIQAVELYWDRAAKTYEEDFSGTTIGKTRRQAVWRYLERIFGPGDRVLEINCGTGLDAVFLAQQGVQLVACDISPQMIEMARQHAERQMVADRVEFLTLATENLGDLEDQSLFDGAFSNFSGLNCVKDLAALRMQLAARLKPGARLLICMMGRIAPWDVFWFLLHKKPKHAFRRLRDEETANAGGAMEFQVHHPSVKKIRSQFAPDFRLRGWGGIGITVPPSYMEHWARRFPRVIGSLAAADERIGGLPVFRSMADCVVLEFERSRTG
jgi:ubiquinone/menaquinone biosynthesis C-methylase UbiE